MNPCHRQPFESNSSDSSWLCLFIGYVQVTDTEAMYLAGLQCAGYFGPYDDSFRITRYKQSAKFFPKRILNCIPDERSREQMLINQHKKPSCSTLTKPVAQRSYILKCLTTLPLFGSALYDQVDYRGFVNKDRKVKVAVNATGIYLIDQASPSI